MSKTFSQPVKVITRCFVLGDKWLEQSSTASQPLQARAIYHLSDAFVNAVRNEMHAFHSMT